MDGNLPGSVVHGIFQTRILEWAAISFSRRLIVWITTNCGKFFEIRIPDYLTCLLRKLYSGQEATVRIGHATTDTFQIRKGVCQGYILSPGLFNLYVEYIV